MVPFHLEAEVPESREVTLTLPLDTPMGRVQIQVTPLPAPPTTTLFRPTDPAVATEFDSFMRLLPSLRITHGGHYAAVRSDQVIASGVFLDTVLRLARMATNGAPFFCGWVEPPEGYAFRSGQLVVEDEVVP